MKSLILIGIALFLICAYSLFYMKHIDGTSLSQFERSCDIIQKDESGLFLSTSGSVAAMKVILSGNNGQYLHELHGKNKYGLILAAEKINNEAITIVQKNINTIENKIKIKNNINKSVKLILNEFDPHGRKGEREDVLTISGKITNNSAVPIKKIYCNLAVYPKDPNFINCTDRGCRSGLCYDAFYRARLDIVPDKIVYPKETITFSTHNIDSISELESQRPSYRSDREFPIKHHLFNVIDLDIVENEKYKQHMTNISLREQMLTLTLLKKENELIKNRSTITRTILTLLSYL